MTAFEDYLLKKGTATYWQTSVGNAVDTIVEPIHLEREERIEKRKKLFRKKSRKSSMKGKK